MKESENNNISTFLKILSIFITTVVIISTVATVIGKQDVLINSNVNRITALEKININIQEKLHQMDKKLDQVLFLLDQKKKD